jgi:hypothetical protein
MNGAGAGMNGAGTGCTARGPGAQRDAGLHDGSADSAD